MITHRHDGDCGAMSVSVTPASGNTGNNSDRFKFVLSAPQQPFNEGEPNECTEISFTVVGGLELMDLLAGFAAVGKFVC